MSVHWHTGDSFDLVFGTSVPGGGGGRVNRLSQQECERGREREREGENGGVNT